MTVFDAVNVNDVVVLKQTVGYLLLAPLAWLLLPRQELLIAPSRHAQAIAPRTSSELDDDDATPFFVLVALMVTGWFAKSIVGFFLLGIPLILLIALLVIYTTRGRMTARDVLWAWLAVSYVILYGGILSLGGAAFLAYVIYRKRRSWMAILVKVGAPVVATATTLGIAMGLVGVPFVMAAVLLAALPISGIAAWRFLRTRLSRRPVAAGLAVLGGIGASAVVLVFLSLAGLVERDLAASGLFIRQQGLQPAPGPFVDPLASDVQRVAEAYQPFLVHTSSERWHPSSAAQYLREANFYHGTLKLPERRKKRLADVTCSLKPEESHKPEEAHCVLSISCPNPDLACADDPEGIARVVYARVVDDPLAAEGLSPDDVEAPLSELRRLIQYWVFYRYDDWRAWLGNGLRQWHEGDWEWVTVGVSDREPLFVAYSAHCGGRWREWNKVGALDGGRTSAGELVAGNPLTTGHHALVFVAEGSHAMYPDPRDVAPNWKSCKDNIPAALDAPVWGPTHSVAALERVVRDMAALEDLRSPRVVLADQIPQQFLSFKGYWSGGDHLRWLWHGGNCRYAHAGAPNGSRAVCTRTASSPGTKGVWRRPIEGIFCSPYFHPRDKCPRLLRD